LQRKKPSQKGEEWGKGNWSKNTIHRKDVSKRLCVTKNLVAPRRRRKVAQQGRKEDRRKKNLEKEDTKPGLKESISGGVSREDCRD